MARLVRSRPVSRVPAQQGGGGGDAPRDYSAKENRHDFAFQWKTKEFFLSSLDHSSSTEFIRPCQIILASFNSLQSDASLWVKEKRQELLPDPFDSRDEGAAKHGVDERAIVNRVPAGGFGRYFIMLYDLVSVTEKSLALVFI